MAEASMFERPSNGSYPLVVRTLVSLSTTDSLYTDHYLRRAEALLRTICTRERYTALNRLRTDLPRLTEELRRAIGRGAWPQVRGLAENAAQAREQLAATDQILQLADAVYGHRLVHLDAAILALNGVIVGPALNLRRARDGIVEQLRSLATADGEWAQFYRKRIAHFEALELVLDDELGTLVDGAEVQKRLLAAVDKSDFARVQRLAESIVTEGAGRPGRLRAPRPTPGTMLILAAPLPATSVERALDLGLSVEMLRADNSLNGYLSCCCAERATFPDPDRPAKHPCTCGHACPPSVRPSLRENLDLVIGHPFVNSAGSRYLPWFGPESVLVETFPEDDSDRRTTLTEMLHLTQRHALPRVAIEDALLTHGESVCSHLGLDPAEFVVVCIPFDVYFRLAPKYSWGLQEHWTHFDGYQVTRDVQFLALVGGNSRYGGPDDLSSLGRDYDSQILRTRFAIVRRQRFLVRASAEAA